VTFAIGELEGRWISSSAPGSRHSLGPLVVWLNAMLREGT
jgi:hypothetical protein